MKILEVKNLTKIYKKYFFSKSIIKALDNLSFTLNKGEILGVIGPNGSGKTTLFKTILGFIKPTNGSITLFENKYKGLELKSKIGFLYEKVNFYTELTAKELLEFYAKLYNVSSKDISSRVNYILKIIDLEEFKSMKIKNFSKGMLQRVGIGVTLINDTDLLIFDEIISGLDPYGASKIYEILKVLKNEGKTIVISSHVLSHIQDICSDILIFHKGKIIKEGKLDDIVKDTTHFKIEIKLHETFDEKKALDLLNKSGFEIEKTYYSNRDLENIFISLIKEEKNV